MAKLTRLGLWLSFLTMLVAKLTGNLHWSWWAVTCPIWGSFAALGFLLSFARVYADESRDGR